MLPPTLLLLAAAQLAQLAQAKILIRIDPTVKYQTFDGLGISEAFQRARQIYGADGLSPSNTQKVLDLLFSNVTGAGLTILRNGIGSSNRDGYDFMKSIAPDVPGVKTQPPAPPASPQAPPSLLNAPNATNASAPSLTQPQPASLGTSTESNPINESASILPQLPSQPQPPLLGAPGSNPADSTDAGKGSKAAPLQPRSPLSGASAASQGSRLAPATDITTTADPPLSMLEAPRDVKVAETWAGTGAVSSNIESSLRTFPPSPPGSLPMHLWNSTPPHYTWDNEDSGQLRLTWDALGRGLRTVYADAWSAPGWMKNNFNDSNGGHLCGVDGVTCRQGDMRTQYADYLVRHLKFYQQQGVKIDYLGFLNEPDYNVSYASMQSTGGQAASFLPFLHRALKASNLTTKVVCCEGMGWEQSRDHLGGLKLAGAEDSVDVISSHGYSTSPGTPFNTTRKVWQTEWADLDSGYNTLNWYFNGSAGEGLTWAIRIQDAFTKSNVSAFLGWVGAGNSTTNSVLIQLRKDEVRVSKRLWAFAQFSRFVRLGATRIQALHIPANSTASKDTPSAPPSAASTLDPSPPPSAHPAPSHSNIHVSAFANPDGGFAIQVINNSAEDECVQIEGLTTRGAILRRYLTNEDYDLSKISIDVGRFGGAASAAGGGPAKECSGNIFGASPARSMVSFVLEKILPIG